MKEIIEGIVEEVIYQNTDNGYTVLELDREGVLVTAVGALPALTAGERVKLAGQWAEHAQYGMQFKVKYIEKLMPSDAISILSYLSSGIISGVRAATAKKIVERFGVDTFDVIRKTPEKLTLIKGISPKRAGEISRSFLEHQAEQNTVIFLQKYGVSVSMALKIYKRFGVDAVSRVSENPFLICDHIGGISFKAVDKLAGSMGVNAYHGGRLQSGLLYTLLEATLTGHTALPEEELIVRAMTLLGVERTHIAESLIGLVLERRVISETRNGTTFMYLPAYFNAEAGVARRLHVMAGIRHDMQLFGVDEELARLQEGRDFRLSAEQEGAVKKALLCSLVIVTGGPGTGKTTIINAIIRLLEKTGLHVALAAPTGRAAKRMSEMTGMEAKTIHRLLEVGFVSEAGEEGQQFARCESMPLETDAVIVDEASMMDILLMDSLLKALAPGTRLVLVGDVDQLPSVGPGMVLKDIINSGSAEVVRLNEVYRQAALSMIVVNAHRINHGEYPIINMKDKDFFFLSKQSAAQVVDTIADLCARRLPAGYGFDPITEIQVLTPVRKTAIGVNSLNAELQRRLNPASEQKAERAYGDVVFRVGDKVMQMRNNYELGWTRGAEKGKGIFNGDVGIVSGIRNSIITVTFDDEKKAEYDSALIEDLEPAYAMTVHKSQGNEFPAVVIPIFHCAPMLMTRNLLYTAITRAKQLVVLVGLESAVIHMVQNNAEIKRHSGLCDKLKEAQTPNS